MRSLLLVAMLILVGCGGGGGGGGGGAGTSKSIVNTNEGIEFSGIVLQNDNPGKSSLLFGKNTDINGNNFSGVPAQGVSIVLFSDGQVIGSATISADGSYSIVIEDKFIDSNRQITVEIHNDSEVLASINFMPIDIEQDIIALDIEWRPSLSDTQNPGLDGLSVFFNLQDANIVIDNAVDSDNNGVPDTIGARIVFSDNLIQFDRDLNGIFGEANDGLLLGVPASLFDNDPGNGYQNNSNDRDLDGLSVQDTVGQIIIQYDSVTSQIHAFSAPLRLIITRSGSHSLIGAEIEISTNVGSFYGENPIAITIDPLDPRIQMHGNGAVFINLIHDFPAFTVGTVTTTATGNNGDDDSTGGIFIEQPQISLTLSMFLGGVGNEIINDIAVDVDGNIYVTGGTRPECVDPNDPFFPTTPGAFQREFANGSISCSNDAFVVKCSPGGEVIYATYLGGNSLDIGNAIAVDDKGNAYIVGTTKSWNFPVKNPIQEPDPNKGPTLDIFITKINPDGSDLIYSTYIIGNTTDRGSDIFVDDEGNAYVVGSTFSTDFPTTQGVIQEFDNFADSDIVVLKINPAGNEIVFSTYIGGADSDLGASIAVDSNGDIYITGATSSLDFPVFNAFQQDMLGSDSAFVTKINAKGTEFIYSTYLGGWDIGGIMGNTIAVDSFGNAYIGGTLPNHVQAFVTKLNPFGSDIVYKKNFGGSKLESVRDLVVDTAGNVYAVGSTSSENFPVHNAMQSVRGGAPFVDSSDGFMTKIDPSGETFLFSTYLGGSSSDFVSCIALGPNGNICIAGATSSVDFPSVTTFESNFGGVGDGFITIINAIED